MELVVMAAGLGSRFGGLKQIQPVGPNGEFIIDYSVFDAKRAGFDKVVFIIKKEIEKEFKETIGKRLENKIKVEYAFQEMDNIPDGTSVPEERTKPLGTGHALYTARDFIDEPFAVISADDFYGKEAFEDLANVLSKGDEYLTIGYKISTTLTENGSVKRGVIFTEDGYLTDIKESKVEKNNGVVNCEVLDTGEKYTVEDNHPVSMLMFGLLPETIEYVNRDIVDFFNNADLTKDEFYLPNVLDHMIKDGTKFKVVNTDSVWKGVTYASDLDELKEYINDKIESGVYPKDLWK